MESRRINRWITAYLIVAGSCVAGIAYGVDSLETSTDVASRLDKMGAVGVLSFALILSLGALVYLIRLQYGRMMDVLEKAGLAMQKMSDTLDHMDRS